ncbi:alpha,alpha-trehalase TreF [Halomonas sp. McH1-25]|uniref:alpha,alpha-trehalase TreF n=1 Tax=unclassified Halomonas TaxID=2609666 RepID=UPI001EF5EA8D|nr:MULTISPECIES: alpha,alpha-trehalase TreF [unclassified Halomonas]MCG7601909.1 alpha,alpha-trehalase TreF [Halomonas sp. McH1-25]MCP1343916.1 alpha,alpha-trehalase TreF [Halomonas sp. FL8]MCP1361888.1 alpha,alpha-trehalase TreF [Halomonas sp. BBD45]
MQCRASSSGWPLAAVLTLCLSGLPASGFADTPLPSSPVQEAADIPPPPDLLWGDLFFDVQTRGIFEDSKTFVDLIPTQPAPAVLEDYARFAESPAYTNDAALRDFVEEHFRTDQVEEHAPLPEGQPVIEHIDALWPVLTREPDTRESRWSSRLPLPYAYVVPGGRFNEIYYWDSYFTMLGLLESGLQARVRDMTNNFAYLIEEYGHIPNGNRTYYLTRSQPPFFASMVDLVASFEGSAAYTRYLPALQAEYDYWMDGAETLAPGEAYRRVVRLDDGRLLNRYWDDANTPRQESFSEDLATAEESARPATEVWRNLQAGAESGWDFSSRWLADEATLATIRTTDIAPVDLNSLLYHLERTLAKAYALDRRHEQAQAYRQRADARRQTIRDVLWSEADQAFGDYLWQQDRLTGTLSSATAFPLFYGIADAEQAAGTALTLEQDLLMPGGLVTTLNDTGQQWDAPNGWAPQQWVAIEGLRQYGNHRLARMIAERWVATNLERYRAEGKLVEKYNVIDNRRAGGGEYPAQDGFGWTNGVLRKLLALYPELADKAVAQGVN